VNGVLSRSLSLSTLSSSHKRWVHEAGALDSVDESGQELGWGGRALNEGQPYRTEFFSTPHKIARQALDFAHLNRLPVKAFVPPKKTWIKNLRRIRRRAKNRGR